ncbi:hypothetical protein JOE58_002637 [Curtobacterium luteum]|uniref:Uncharacterized protein n=1 Tax=Curtobacterium luteum TaxID=33881 RepID=A0ABS2RZ47_9MICO|nr:hypothetical protein [Curtobacterium luteum]
MSDSTPLLHDRADRDVFASSSSSYTWAAGEERYIPRLWGKGYWCTITEVDRVHVKFDGPWGPGAISHDLLTVLDRVMQERRARAVSRPRP